MRLLVLLAAIAMPIVGWLTNSGTFGPDNGTMSDRYPTLLVAAGYADPAGPVSQALGLLVDRYEAEDTVTAGRRRAAGEGTTP